uniref:RalA-binding protein 1 n=1 Tax=Rhabditophanes sp. KR3021 TaxID=114890 RepID=A0AC35TS86_9BILA
MLSSTVSPIPNQDRETISRSDFGSSHERTSSSKRNSISIVSSNLAMAVEDRISASITATINNNLVALNGDVHPSTSSASTTDPVHNISTTPNSLEELLEKQWGKGIQLFSHIKGPCDLSQLLTCLEELQKESKAMQQEEIDLNKRLEHLTNVNTRLRLTLKSSQEAKDPVHESNKFPVEEKTLGSTVVSSPASLVADTPQVVINNVPSHPAVMSPVMSPAPSHVASSIGSVQSPKLNSTPVASVTNVTPPLHIAPSANIPNIATPVSVPQQRTLTPHVPMQITPSPAAVPSTISNTINSTVNNTINSSVRPATSTPNHTNLPFSVVNNLNTNSISNQLSLLAQATGQSGNGFGSAEDIQNQIRTAAMASKFPPVATRPESRTNQQAINFMSRNNASIDSPMVSTASQQQVHQQVQQQVQQQLQQQQQQQLAELARVQALNSNSHNLNNTLAATSFSKTMSSDNSPRASVQTSYGSTNAPVNGMNMMNVNNLANQFLLNRSSASGTPMTAPPTHAGIGNSAEMNIRDILSYLAGPLNGLERGSALTNLNNSLTGANNNNHPNTNGTTQLSLDQQHNILSTLFNFQSNPQNPNLLMTNYLAHAAQQQQQQQRTQQLSNMFNHQLTANLMNVQGTMSSPSIVNQGLATGTPPPTVQQLNSGNIMSSALAK